MKKHDPIGYSFAFIPDPEAMKQKYCACNLCAHLGLCRYSTKFIERQQNSFPVILSCWMYEKRREEDADN